MSEEIPAASHGKIIVFGAKQIRRIWHDEQWFFSVVGIIGALTDSGNPRNYWNMMKARELKQSEVQLSTLCVQLKLASSDGKSYKTDCVNVEAAFRIIQSIPSPKAEPFKQWLATVGYQRVQEIENPELALIFTMLGEASTTEIAWNKDAQGFDQNKITAREGGSVAGNARRELETKSGRKVVTPENYLTDKPKPKLLPKSERSS